MISTSDCLKVDKNKINFCKYPIFGSSSKQIVLIVDLYDYFIDYQKKDFHMLKLKTTTSEILHGLNANVKQKDVFTVKVV